MALYDTLLDKLEGKEYSNYFVSCCVFHDDHSPSMFVYEDGWFRCAACGKKGTIVYLDKFLGSHHRATLTRSQSVPTVLPQWRRWEEKYGSLEGIVNYAHQTLLRYKRFRSFFKKRQIDSFIEQGYLGYLDSWALFPVYNIQRKLVDVVVRSIATNSVRYVVHPMVGEQHRPLYIPNVDRVLKSGTVYVTFGIIDAISLELIGLPAVTGITGKSLSVETLKPLGKKLIIIPDDGEEKEAYLLANRLGWRASVKKLKYPDDVKDPDEYRRKFGNTQLLTALGA